MIASAPNPQKAHPDAIEKAARILKQGRLVVMPTETVYGLAADAGNAQAVARIFKVKGRPSFNPLICHVASPKDAEALVNVTPLAQKLMAAFWPGPLTLVLEKRPDAPVCDLVSAGLPSLAIRMPSHDVARALLKAVGCPLAAPSANRSGRISPTEASHVAQDLADDLGKDVGLILDGGPCNVGLESTIVAVKGEALVLLRPGAITADQITDACGVRPVGDQSGTITAPGQMLSHYAPDAAVRLEAKTAKHDEVLIGFGPIKGDLSLSEDGDLIEAAARLFSCLRSADTMGKKKIAVAPVPPHGLGLAINDRLRRAAAPKNNMETST
ncbi:threonylcarbamoyl-AMP synthase [Iodidimonas gelatinilytica]|uniref:Threonylcarbamoyl-AMP synthase n=1 Tax=Iodidimonas gelatinilytica TaxID=1236966 RepID=A0A5A7MV58_9PROT|nr:L-threonylcarbamoyladenylate synthase [Iodidimonas gelatinilytica]GEQ99807.1 threonylcarbamoyl-AMP synthase [Iodidimonas gelatinilytica]